MKKATKQYVDKKEGPMEGDQYDVKIINFFDYLTRQSQTKIYDLIQRVPTPLQILTLDLQGVPNTNNFSFTNDGSNFKTTIDSTLENIEAIVKILNKHRAVLEASKGLN